MRAAGAQFQCVAARRGMDMAMGLNASQALVFLALTALIGGLTWLGTRGHRTGASGERDYFLAGGGLTVQVSGRGFQSKLIKGSVDGFVQVGFGITGHVATQGRFGQHKL